jgi:hypothetical protein
MLAFIVMRDRLTMARQLADHLAATGCTPILVDNASTYPPLLDWYYRCPYKVHRLAENRGHLCVWRERLPEFYGCNRYIVTDHDLDLSLVPNDYLQVLTRGLDTNPWAVKAGLSLELDDLPDNQSARDKREWESQFWAKPLTTGYYQAFVDTTLALYDHTRLAPTLPQELTPGNIYRNPFLNAVRTLRPYTARHLPWYLPTERALLDPEERYYVEHCDPAISTYSKEYK